MFVRMATSTHVCVFMLLGGHEDGHGHEPCTTYPKGADGQAVQGRAMRAFKERCRKEGHPTVV